MRPIKNARGAGSSNASSFASAWLLFACVALAFVPSATADIWTGCVPGLSGPAVVGDGPFVGDAPDDTAVPVVLGCYTGVLSTSGDLDSFQLLSGWHSVAPGPQGTVMRFWSLEGCFDATISVVDVGTQSTLHLCAGDAPRGLAVLGGSHTIVVGFATGPGAYQFAFE